MSKKEIRSIDDLRAAVEGLSATDNESFQPVEIFWCRL